MSKGDMVLIYPFGCTMTVVKPSAVAFTSGTTTFPVDRPLSALYYNQNTGKYLVIDKTLLTLNCKQTIFQEDDWWWWAQDTCSLTST